MFDKNYLDHDLVFDGGLYRDYVCQKCKIKVWYEYSIKSGDIYRDLTDALPGFKKINLTCEEYIIKGIIE